MHSLGYRLLGCAGLALVFTNGDRSLALPCAVRHSRRRHLCSRDRCRERTVCSGNSRTDSDVPRKTIVIVQHLRTATLALPQPTADRSLIRARMNDVTKELASFRSAKAAAASNNPNAYESDVAEARFYDDPGAKAAKKLGLKSCED